MAPVQAKPKIDVACDPLIVWQGIGNEITVQTSKARVKYWNTWTSYYEECNVGPYLDTITPCESTIILASFAAQVITGDYGNGSQVRVQTVTQALTVISKTCQLVVKPSTFYEAEG